jgi:hypothetical protein
MLPDDPHGFPARPPSEVEWEDLLVRVEIAPRALRIAVEEARADPALLAGALRVGVRLETLLQRALEAIIDERAMEDGDGVSDVSGGPADLVAEYERLRYRSFLMVQRRGINVWDWTVRGGTWDGATAYQLFQAAARRDGVLLARVRGTREEGAAE